MAPRDPCRYLHVMLSCRICGRIERAYWMQARENSELKWSCTRCANDYVTVEVPGVLRQRPACFQKKGCPRLYVYDVAKHGRAMSLEDTKPQPIQHLGNAARDVILSFVEAEARLSSLSNAFRAFSEPRPQSATIVVINGREIDLLRRTVVNPQVMNELRRMLPQSMLRNVRVDRPDNSRVARTRRV